jgi:3-oxoacyl-[acyl-carrier protein] reductase
VVQVFDGQGAVVTGGSRGIGRAVVTRLAREGAAVAFSYRTREDAADELVAKLTGEGARVAAFRAEMGDPAEVRQFFAAAAEWLGGVDMLVNNAGETLVATIADTTDDDFDRLMAVNARAAFVLIREAGRALRRGGRIVNISTANTVMHAPGIALYAATKAAVEQFTLVAARELAIRKITVNTVSPGPVETEMLTASQTSQALDMAAAMTPLRRLGKPEDVADVVTYLLGPDARWLTGQNIRAAGGLV